MTELKMNLEVTLLTHVSDLFRYGVEYLGMMNGRADLEFDGEVEQFTIHHILCFDPVRRRMSVIVEDSKGRNV